MARNRMIKPEFWASETLMRVSRDSRLLFIGLWNFCDDYGFCMGAPRRVLGDVFPVDESVTEANIKKWLTELIEINVVIPLEYKSKKLLFIKSWGEHQTVQHKSKRSFIDTVDLEQVIKDTLDSHETLMRNYLDSHAPKRKKKEKEKEESNKKKHLDCVFLTEDQFSKLLKKYETEDRLKLAIDILNNYKMSNNKKYDSDYHVLIGWVFDKFKSDDLFSPPTNQKRALIDLDRNTTNIFMTEEEANSKRPEGTVNNSMVAINGKLYFNPWANQ